MPTSTCFRRNQSASFKCEASLSPAAYYGATEANRVFHDDGWFETGDLGFLSRGELYLTGRAKETIIVNGVNHGCSEIEELVNGEEGVEPSYSAACAVRKRGTEGEQLAIFFHTAQTSPRELAALLKRIRGNLARRLGIQPDYLIPVPKESIPKRLWASSNAVCCAAVSRPASSMRWSGGTNSWTGTRGVPPTRPTARPACLTTA